MAMDAEKFTEKAVKVFRDCSLVPAVVAARILPVEGEGRYEVEARWSQREMERGKKLAYTKSYFVEKKGNKVDKLCATTFQADATKVVKVAYASECNVRAVLVKDKQAKAEESAKPQQYIEVWNGSVLTKTISVEDLKKHGTINEDVHFGSFLLSPDGKQLLYIAEKEKPKSISYFKKEPTTKEDTPLIKGAEYVYEKSWGEQLSKVINPLPVVLTLENQECVVIDTTKFGDISAGQAQWVPGVEGGVVFAGWENRPIKLGFIYCLNRRSALYYVNIKTNEYTKLTDNESCVFNPRFNLQGNRMVYFQAEAGGPHHTCAALKMMEWPSRNISTVIDIVKRPNNPDEFPGFYAVFLPERCWNSVGDRVIFSDNWASYVKVNCVDVIKKSVARISGSEKKGSWSVLDVSHDLIVAQFGSLTTSPQLFIGAVPENTTDSVAWTQLAVTKTVLTDGLKWDITTYNTDDGLYYQSILLTPPPPPSSTDTPPTPRPLAVFPHGGPHTVFPVDFMVWPVCLAALGFTVLLVNYRGSAGFGQDNLKSLPGRAGTQDVRDVQYAAESVAKTGVVDRDSVVVLGGSHGGFLSAHLIGQFPDFYKAASIRNPVIDISSMSAISDIPLWCFVEAGAGKYDPTNPRVAEELATLLKCSPITLADKIKAAVLLHLGTDDLRCPNQQGLLLYNTLKAQNKEAKVLMYPGECHPINGVYADADSFVNTAEWLYRHSCL